MGVTLGGGRGASGADGNAAGREGANEKEMGEAGTEGAKEEMVEGTTGVADGKDPKEKELPGKGWA